MRKRTYRKIPVNKVRAETLLASLGGNDVVFAIDVAKTDMVASFVARDGRVMVNVCWKNPRENGLVLGVLRELGAAGVQVEAVMEASGSYGDVLRYQLQQQGVPVFRVSGKRTHDAAEVYDGVPSMHDAKSAAIIAKLHLDRASAPWLETPLERRELQAAIGTMEMHQDHEQRLVHKLEGWLARHWPEVTELLELTSPTLMALLSRIGGPADVGSRPEESRRLMLGISHRLMSEEKIDAVIAGAAASAGVPLVEQERAALQELAGEAHRALLAFKKAKARVETMSLDVVPARLLAPEVGKATAAVLVADVGNPGDFESVRAYIKAFGLNLKEKSSGKLKGHLSITKRGSARARKYLWLAVLRWVEKDRIARAWYEKKISRDGGKRAKGVIALMRKYAKALFHLARGAPLQSDKLFDTSLLALT